MKLSSKVKPINNFKASAAVIVRQLATRRESMVIAENGETTALIQGMASYEPIQETMGLLKILALGNRQLEAGQVVPADAAITRLRDKKAVA